ncbi:glycosyltransferase family 1 protein [Candidatus Marithrix sp. Canyon 246]|uniref:glycosyltransferase family 1 protein n=1 Tax=Candidatus Marithrix sp. Canyon 246 TaxID=1827136 RepID=UPI00114C8918|nr:glycosyltransferase family 1 protein [Candidatus Marithrix sp. Canyon 246]
MSPVESMTAGKPVIGVAEAVSVMSKDKALTMRAACEKRAQLFRTEVFLEKMRRLI